ncbi:MAG: hypothetical protein AB1555_17845 [Nitrospirota bacterium]
MNILLLGNPYFRQDLVELGHEVKTAKFVCRVDVQVGRPPIAAQLRNNIRPWP